MKVSTGNMWWYFLEKDAKSRIAVSEVNQV